MSLNRKLLLILGKLKLSLLKLLLLTRILLIGGKTWLGIIGDDTHPKVLNSQTVD
jgi:hypothetical protein